MTGRDWITKTWILLAILIGGCAAGGGKSGEADRTMFVTQHPEMDPRFARAVLGGNVLLGMSRDMVEAAWGSPTRVEKLGAGNSKGEERWTFGNYLVNSAVTHLYFRENEVVLYEFVDTQTNATQAVSDPNEKLTLISRPPNDTGGGAKGSP